MKALSHVLIWYQLVLFVTLLPVEVCLVLQWWKYRNHAAIAGRFPLLALLPVAIGATVNLSRVIAIICFPEYASTIDNFNRAGALWMQALLFYRVQLIYVKCTLANQYLLHMTKDSSSSDIDNIAIPSQTKHKGHSVIQYGILATAAVGSVYLAVGIDPPTPPYIITALIGVAVSLNLVRARVKESLGLMTEITMALTMTALVAILTAIAGRVSSTRHQAFLSDLISVSTFTYNHMLGAVLLYVPLRLIHKASARSRVYSIGPQDGVVAVSTPSADRWPDLAEYLQTEECYKIFAQYLASCFALESLMFLERALILHHIILKYKAKSEHQDLASETHTRKEKDMPQGTKYSVRFEYLPDIAFEMESIIVGKCADCEDAQLMHEHYRHGIVQVMRLLFDQFIPDESDTQINISSKVRKPLEKLLASDQSLMLTELISCSYDNLLWVFDAATSDVWNLCWGLYGFQFQRWLSRN